MKVKEMICGMLGAAMLLSATACSGTPSKSTSSDVPSASPVEAQNTDNQANQGETTKAPKYVFLFIGDGMSYPQFQAASDYLGALADEDYTKALPSNSYDGRGGAVLDGPEALNFMNFEVAALPLPMMHVALPRILPPQRPPLPPVIRLIPA